MSGGKSKPDNQQAKSDIDDLEVRFSQVTLKKEKTKFKIASWNMNNLDLAKATRQFIDAVCEIINREQFDLLALQEILDPVVPDKICHILNVGVDTQWSSVTSSVAGKGSELRDEYFGFLYKKKSGIGLTASALMRVNIETEDADNTLRDEYSGFLYKKKSGIKLTAPALMIVNIETDKCELLEYVQEADNKDVNITGMSMLSRTENFTRKPYLGLFEINKIAFSLINVHNNYSKPNKTKSEAKTLVKLTQLVGFGKNAIILGDFNLAHTDEAINGLSYKHKSCIDGPTNQKLDKEYDNIWIRKDMEDQFSIGDAKVIKDNLTYLDGNGQAQNISDHHPIFVTLSIK